MLKRTENNRSVLNPSALEAHSPKAQKHSDFEDEAPGISKTKKNPRLCKSNSAVTTLCNL